MSRLLVVGFAVVLGCGPSASERSERPYKKGFVELEDARDRLVTELIGYTASADDQGIARMLGRPLGYGGMWFLDPGCRRQFAAIGTIPEASVDDFAKCVATLRLATSSRVHAYPDVAILTYPPGIELELHFAKEVGDETATVRWIGYVGRGRASDDLPTITQNALLAQHTNPGPISFDAPTLAEIEKENANEVAKPQPDEPIATSWFRVCLDATGSITDVQLRLTSSVVAQEAFAAAIPQWTFEPFLLGGEPSPVCSLIALDYPGGPSAHTRIPRPVPESHASATVLAAGVLGALVAGVKKIHPDRKLSYEFFEKGITRVTAMLMFCVDDTGQVDLVRLTRPSGVRRYDAELLSGVARWRFAPYLVRGRPFRACSHAAFIYDQINH